MSKPWGGVGAWAAEAEQADAEMKAEMRAKGAAFPGGSAMEAFPSLGEAVQTKPKKKKNQTFSLSEYTTGKYVGPGGKTRQMSETRGLSADEMMLLPTGPRDRTGEESETPGLGGGFRDYGGGYRGGDRERGGEREGRDRDRGFGLGFDRDRDRDGGRMGGRDRDRDDRRDDGPSRADEAENWGSSKKTMLPSSYQAIGERGGGGGYDEERRGLKMSERDLPSRADEADNWGSTKKFVPSLPSEGYDRRERRGGFEERGRGGSGGFEDAPGGVSRADEVDNWGAAKKFVPSSGPPLGRGDRGGGGGGFDSSYRDVGSEADRWVRREAPQRSSEEVRPAERPRLVLQPRSIPIESPAPPPPPSQPVHVNGEIQSVAEPTSEVQTPPKPKPRNNPFGAARPREEVLAEKGHDWRKLDADLEVKEKEKYSRPSSSHSSRSSRPQTPEVGVEQAGLKLRAKVNPFGDAKPREGISDEKSGKDWRKFNLDLEDRTESEVSKVQVEENLGVDVVA